MIQLRWFNRLRCEKAMNAVRHHNVLSFPADSNWSIHQQRFPIAQARLTRRGVRRSGDKVLRVLRWCADGAWRFAAVVGVGFAALILGWVTAADAQVAPCDPIRSNPVVCENSNPGNPPSDWDIGPSSGDPSIQGFATDISVNVGQTVRFKINTTAPAYRIHIYRMGYYAGRGARTVATT